jgi:hypothetical protein
MGLPRLVIAAMEKSNLTPSIPARVNLAIALSQCDFCDLAEKQYAELAAEGVDVVENRAVNFQRQGLHRQCLRMLLPLLRQQPSAVGIRINASAAANDAGKHALALALLARTAA